MQNFLANDCLQQRQDHCNYPQVQRKNVEENVEEGAAGLEGGFPFDSGLLSDIPPAGPRKRGPLRTHSHKDPGRGAKEI